jgi:hypothetical protein
MNPSFIVLHILVCGLRSSLLPRGAIPKMRRDRAGRPRLASSTTARSAAPRGRRTANDLGHTFIDNRYLG